SWTNVEGTEKTYAYLDTVDENHGVKAQNGWNFNVQAGQPMTGVDTVSTTVGGDVTVVAGGTYKLIVESFDKSNNKIATGQIDITIPGMTPEEQEANELLDKIGTAENLAFQKTAFVDSNESTAGNITDGNKGTRWQAATGENTNKYFGVDLGAVKSIDTVLVSWEASVATDYSIYVAGSDGIYGSTPVATVSGLDNNKATIKVSKFAPVDAQYVKVEVTGYSTNAAQYGISPYELAVFGGDSNPEESSSAQENSSGAEAQGPSTPVGLVVDANKQNGLITVAFAPVAEATSYNLYIDGEKVGTIANGGTIPYTSLTAGSHYAQVTAVNEHGESALSAKVDFNIVGETSSENESSTSTQPTDGDYNDLTWTQVGNTDYYVATIHGDVKNAFTLENVIDQGQQMFIAVAANSGTAPVWPAFTDETLNGVSGSFSQGAGITIKYSDLNDNAYNVYEATTAVKNDRFQIIIKAGNPSSGETGDVVTDDLMIDGYQAKVSSITINNKTYEGGIRVVYSKPATVEGKDMSQATEFGLMFGNGLMEAEDLVVSSTDKNVKKIVANSEGIGDGKYAVTMATNFTTASVASLSRTFTVRSYAIIDGVTYYSEAESFTEISVLKAVYESGTLDEIQEAKYLAVIRKVDPNYAAE
ncbi:MAG: discoidin domain-containing protein, partial [Lachnospiraceae bacterium]|nr:discoidin domain-containing protein [Lachnospiraceae bacterium]